MLGGTEEKERLDNRLNTLLSSSIRGGREIEVYRFYGIKKCPASSRSASSPWWAAAKRRCPHPVRRSRRGPIQQKPPDPGAPIPIDPVQGSGGSGVDGQREPPEGPGSMCLRKLDQWVPLRAAASWGFNVICDPMRGFDLLDDLASHSWC